MFMKRTLYASALALSLLITGVAVAQQNQEPDLGAVARKSRAQKKGTAKKTYTNEDFAPVPQAEPAPAATDAKAGDKAADATADKSKAAPATDDKANKAAELQQKVDSLKKEIATLQREYDLADRENRLQVASYYADAGNSLRDPKKFADEQRAKQSELADKKKSIDDAKAKLADTVEQARKSDIKVNE
jgi:hypothetical protein